MYKIQYSLNYINSFDKQLHLQPDLKFKKNQNTVKKLGFIVKTCCEKL